MQPKQSIPEQDATRKIFAITEKLRAQYIDQLQTWKLPRFFSKRGVKFVEGERDSMKIEADAYEITEETNYLSRPANELTTRINDILLRQDCFKSTSDQNLTEAIFSFCQKVNFLVGIAGIGKTTAVEQIVLDWANGKFPRYEGHKEIDIVFFCRCCDLNKYATEMITTEELFQKEFGIDFEEFKQICDPKKVLFILDCLDELPSIDEAFTKDAPRHGLYSIIHDIIVKDSPVLPGCTLLLTTRPHLMKTLDIDILDDRNYIHAEEIIGFAADTVDLYINKFSSGDSCIRDGISKFLDENTSFKLMATVPSILEHICVNIAADLDASTPEKRTSELFIWLFVHLIKNEVQEFNNSSVQEVLAKQSTSILIRVLSKMSYNLLSNGNVLFNLADIYENEDDKRMLRMLESFILKTEATSGSLYKLKYPFLQEFLGAIHCFVSGYAINALLKNQLYDVVGFVGGLARLNQLKAERSDDIFSLFIKCLESTRDESGKDLKWPIVKDIAATIFDSFYESELSEPYRKRQRRPQLPTKQASFCIPQGAFLGTFFELFDIGEKIPEVINLQKELLFAFPPPPTSVSLFQFTHLVQCLIKSRGHHSVSGVTLSVSSYNINAQPEYLTLAEILGHLKSVDISCSSNPQFLSVMSNSMVAFPENVYLRYLIIHGRLPDEQYGILAPCLPLIESLTVQSIEECQKSASKIADHISRYGENSKLKHLAVCSFGFPRDETIAGLSRMFPTLESIDLSGQRLTCKHTEQIAKHISQAKGDANGEFCRLKKLRLQGCFDQGKSPSDAFLHICDIIPFIENIDISNNAIVGSQMDKIADRIIEVAGNTNVEGERAKLFDIESLKMTRGKGGMSATSAVFVGEVKGQNSDHVMAGLTEMKDISKGQSKGFVLKENQKATSAVVAADVKGQTSKDLVGCFTNTKEVWRDQSDGLMLEDNQTANNKAVVSECKVSEGKVSEGKVSEGKVDIPHDPFPADLDAAVDATQSQAESSKIEGDIISTSETVVAEFKGEVSTVPGAYLQEAENEGISITKSESGMMGDDTNALQGNVVRRGIKGEDAAEVRSQYGKGHIYELKSLNLVSCGLDEFSIKHLCRIIPHLEQLDISRAKFAADQATKIVQCIKDCKDYGKLKKIFVDRWSWHLFDELKEQGVIVELGVAPL
eukprot:Seg367.3 transcript_id=Seg367.3/GoldUCD/mRNA.D3Y31 product="NACHT LRR and PYD domains-containing protein 12" protein_id=Seg367.3/GoldUCD/D3Y31